MRNATGKNLDWVSSILPYKRESTFCICTELWHSAKLNLQNYPIWTESYKIYLNGHLYLFYSDNVLFVLSGLLKKMVDIPVPVKDLPMMSDFDIARDMIYSTGTHYALRIFILSKCPICAKTTVHSVQQAEIIFHLVKHWHFSFYKTPKQVDYLSLLANLLDKVLKVKSEIMTSFLPIK